MLFNLWRLALYWSKASIHCQVHYNSALVFPSGSWWSSKKLEVKFRVFCVLFDVCLAEYVCDFLDTLLYQEISSPYSPSDILLSFSTRVLVYLLSVRNSIMLQASLAFLNLLFSLFLINIYNLANFLLPWESSDLEWLKNSILYYSLRKLHK